MPEEKVDLIEALTAANAPEPEKVETPVVKSEEQKAAPEQQESTPPVEPEVPAHQPGTPDKVVQKMQQDLGAATRKLEELLTKVDAGQTLTPKEVTQAVSQKRKIDELNAKIGNKTFDVIDDAETLAAVAAEQDGRLETLNKEISGLKSLVEQQQQYLQKQQAETVFADYSQQFPGVDVKGVWDRAAAEALEILGEDATPRQLQRLADKTFLERCEAATKSVAAKQQPTAPGSKPRVPATPTTPGGAKITPQGTVNAANLPVSQADREMNDYLALVAK